MAGGRVYGQAESLGGSNIAAKFGTISLDQILPASA